MNFNLDIALIEEQLDTPIEQEYFDAVVSGGVLTSLITGGCLLATSVVMLMFYIKHYIDTHRKNLGILKALGYSRFGIAKHFYVFGVSVFVGAVLGYIGAHILMPMFYEINNKDGVLPAIAINFHFPLLFFFVIVPTLVFAALAIWYGYYRLKTPVLSLLTDSSVSKAPKVKATKENAKQRSFLDDLRGSVLRQKKSLMFFVAFSAFCFGALLQMAWKMKDLASEMMAITVFSIAVVLAFTTLLISLTTVVAGNSKTIAIMQAMGYSRADCRRSILDGYRPLGYIGFAIGTVYQHFLMVLMTQLVYADIENMPAYEFDFVVMAIVLAAFVALYEALIYIFARRLNRISIKEIMLG
jgi:ABC-type lipoprotein release transport system permease subunit